MPATSQNERALVFRRNLRRLLQREFLSQREAADQIGVSYKWMRRLCHQGLERIDRRTEPALQKLADRFDLRVDDLWREDIAEKLESTSGQALVKWTGSKKRQSAEIIRHFPKKIETFYEPFVGGGSVLYRLLESGIPVEQYRCSDTCRPLIALWKLVKNDPRRLVEQYEEMWSKLRDGRADYYTTIRNTFNHSNDPALFFFLLRTCRNGLVRFNQAGEFTAAYHHGRDGIKPERVKGVIEDWNRTLNEHDVRFYVRDYRRIQSSKNDLLYLDPPYKVRSRTYFYDGRFDFPTLFRWLRKQDANYLLSLNGFVGKEDRRLQVPDDLFNDHVLVHTGRNPMLRQNGSSSKAVRDSLYLKIKTNKQKPAKKAKWETIIERLDNYCGNRFIHVPKDDWSVLADAARESEAAKQIIAETLADTCGRYAAPCPLVSEIQRKTDFQRFLYYKDERQQVDISLSGLSSVLHASKWSRSGSRFLNSWFLENRISGNHRSSPSLKEAWHDPIRRTSIMRAALSLKKHLNVTTAYESASLKLHVPANFRPSAAKAVFNDIGNRGAVLDFSAGYGGRFLGFSGSHCKHYIGIDPNTELKPSFEAMFDWIEEHHEHDKSWEMIWEPAEDVDYRRWRRKVDLIFTSPPYFNLERYSDQSTQSSARYRSLEEWLERFLFTTLRKVTMCLKRGGHLALNIADNNVYGIKMVERVVEFVTKQLGLCLGGVVPYLLSSKPGSNRSLRNRTGWGKKVEPVLLFCER